MKRLLLLVGILLIALPTMGGCIASAPAKEIDTINKAYEVVYFHLDDLAKTSHAKEFLGDLSDAITNVDCSVLTTEGEEKEVDFDYDLENLDFDYYVVRRWYHYIVDYSESPPIGNNVLGGVSFERSSWHNYEDGTIVFAWLVDPVDGAVRPFNGNAYRVEAELIK